MSNDDAIGKLRAILTSNGYLVIEQAKDGSECLRKIRALKPDILIIDYNLPLTNGYEVARVAVEDKISDVILIATESQAGAVDDLRPESGFICMTKPLNKLALIASIELMIKSRRKINQLEKEIQELKSTLDTRREVEKAKGLLMKNLNLSEAEAFKRIQKQSMDRGIPMKEIAKAIILAYDI